MRIRAVGASLVVLALATSLSGIARADSELTPGWVADVRADGGPAAWVADVKTDGGPPAWVSNGAPDEGTDSAGAPDDGTSSGAPGEGTGSAHELPDQANVPGWVADVIANGGPPAWVEDVKANGGPPAFVQTQRSDKAKGH